MSVTHLPTSLKMANVQMKSSIGFELCSEVTIVLEPGAVLAEVVHLLRSAALMPKISLRTEIAPSLPLILGDRIQLQQCVMNLVLNALEAWSAPRSDHHEW